MPIFVLNYIIIGFLVIMFKDTFFQYSKTLTVFPKNFMSTGRVKIYNKKILFSAFVSLISEAPVLTFGNQMVDGLVFQLLSLCCRFCGQL